MQHFVPPKGGVVMRVDFDIMKNIHLTPENDQEVVLSRTEEFSKLFDSIMNKYKYEEINLINICKISKEVNEWLVNPVFAVNHKCNIGIESIKVEVVFDKAVL